MRKFWSLLIVSVVVGCGSLSEDYIRADRATYVAMQPCIDAGIAAVGSESLEGRAFKMLNESWDGRLRAAEEGR